MLPLVNPFSSRLSIFNTWYITIIIRLKASRSIKKIIYANINFYTLLSTVYSAYTSQNRFRSDTLQNTATTLIS